MHLWNFTRDAQDEAWLMSRKHSMPTVIFQVANKKSWREYYEYYTMNSFPNHIIIKSDDDIVYIDIESFGQFIEKRKKDTKSILLFPNIVNNGVCVFLQQENGLLKFNDAEFPTSDPLFPKFSHETYKGKLWSDGGLCESLHRYFIENHDEWIGKCREFNKPVAIEPGERISINFFAVMSEDLYSYKALSTKKHCDDERFLTEDVTKKMNIGNSIDMGMTVAHLSFYSQKRSMDEEKLLKMYNELADKVIGYRI